MVQDLRKIVLLIVIAGLIMPILPAAHAFAPALPPPVPSDNTRKAIIISSLDDFSPMRDIDVANLDSSLMQAGYTVTYLKDGAVTLDFIAGQLNNYQIIYWRTQAYEQDHVLYWYIGQRDSRKVEQTYVSDIASEWLDSSHGILGVSAAFFSNVFKPNTLSNVKLMFIVSSQSALIAQPLIAAGVKAIIDFSANIDLEFNWVDYLTTITVRYLADGMDVGDAVSNTIVPLITTILRDPLDSADVPPMAYTGDSGLMIV
jgi:hypothetical protein